MPENLETHRVLGRVLKPLSERTSQAARVAGRVTRGVVSCPLPERPRVGHSGAEAVVSGPELGHSGPGVRRRGVGCVGPPLVTLGREPD